MRSAPKVLFVGFTSCPRYGKIVDYWTRIKPACSARRTEVLRLVRINAAKILFIIFSVTIRRCHVIYTLIFFSIWEIFLNLEQVRSTFGQQVLVKYFY